MTTEYTATVRIEDGSLTVTRPHPSVGPVDDLVDSLVYTVRDDSTIVAVEVTVEVMQTSEEPTGGPVLSASATGSLNPPVPPTAPDPLPSPGA